MRYFSIEKKLGRSKTYWTLHLKEDGEYMWIFGKFGSKKKAMEKAEKMINSELNKTKYKAEGIRIKE